MLRVGFAAFAGAGWLKSNGSADGSVETSGTGTAVGRFAGEGGTASTGSTASAIITSALSASGTWEAMTGGVPGPGEPAAGGAEGTRNVLPHFVHLAFRPSMVSGALNFLAHPGHDTSITEGLPILRAPSGSERFRRWCTVDCT